MGKRKKLKIAQKMVLVGIKSKDLKPLVELGIEQTKEFLMAIVKIANLVRSILTGGWLGVFPKVIKTIPAIAAAIDGLTYIPSELGDLSDDEITELVHMVKDECEWITDGKAWIEMVLDIALKIKKLIGLIF